MIRFQEKSFFSSITSFFQSSPLSSTKFNFIKLFILILFLSLLFFSFRQFITKKKLTTSTNNLNNNKKQQEIFNEKIKNIKFSKIKIHDTHLSEKDFLYSSALLENVCLNQKGEILFFTTEDLYKSYYSPILKIVNNIITFIQSWLNGDRGAIKLNFKFEEIPKINKFSKTPIRWIEKPVAMQLRYASGSISHLLMDNLAPLVELITKFNLNPKDVIILYMDEINYRDYSTTKKEMTCAPYKKLQANLLVKNPNTQQYTFCKEEMSSYLFDKVKTIELTQEWTRYISNQPILQKCTYPALIDEPIFNEKLDKEEQLEEDEKEPILVHTIEEGPCPRDLLLLTANNQKENNQKYNELITKLKRLDNQYFNSDESNENNMKIMEQKREEINVCFKKLILGTGERNLLASIYHSHFRENALLALREKILKSFHLDKKVKVPLQKRKNLKILLNVNIRKEKNEEEKKKPNYTCSLTFNTKEFINNLKEKLNNDLFIRELDQTIEIEALENIHSDMKDNVHPVEYFSDVDIFLSTFSDDSYYALFMPQFSYFIYLPYCWVDTTHERGFHCMHSTYHLFATMPHLNLLDGYSLINECKSVDSQCCGIILNEEYTFEMIRQILKLRLQ
ncbi:hypothetical protein ABK040_015422 [Willaertia magna]